MKGVSKIWSRKEKERESGFVLLETLLSVPMTAILLTALCTAGLFGLRSYALILSDMELHEEMNNAMQRVVEDMESAGDIRIVDGDNHNSFIKMRPWTDYLEMGYEVSYWRRAEIAGPHGQYGKLVRNRSSDPLTGNHVLAGVSIDHFWCEEVPARVDRAHAEDDVNLTDSSGLQDALYRVEFIGHSKLSQHRYRICTMVHIRKRRSG